MFVVDTRHNSTADSHYAVATTYEAAARCAHEFFLSYDFEIRDGRPFDSGNDDGAEGGFDCLDNLRLFTTEEGEVLVAGFMHCGGDGPCCVIAEAETLA